MTVLLSLVVVNWDSRSALTRVVPTLEASLDRLSGATELIVVDNGSTDGSVDYLRSRPRCIVIENSANLGFSPAANQGIRASTGRYVALVNNDVVCHPDWLRNLIAVAEADEGIGSVGAQLRYLHDPGRLNSAGLVVDILGRARDRHDGMPASTEPAAPVEVFGVSAGAALYRRAMLDEIGLLDERFFAYLEDVDLAWRARRAGWRSCYEPRAVVLHEYSASSSRVRGLKTYLSARNHVWMLARNGSVLQLVIAGPFLCVLSLWTLVMDIRKRDLSGLRGLGAGIRGSEE